LVNSQYTYPVFELPDPKRHFLASENQIYDYAHLYGFCTRFKNAIEEYSVSEDHPIALLSRSSDELTFVVAACYLLKVPFVPMNPELTDSELASQIKQINPSVVYYDSDNEGRLQDLPQIHFSREDISIVASSRELPPLTSDPESRFGYFFTSGSSGRPKVVPLKRRQMLFAAEASAANFKPDPDRYWLLCLPLNHIGGISIILRSILYGSAIFRMDKFDRHQIRNFLSENKLFQVASLVPTMLRRLLDDPLFQLHLEFKAVLLGGGPLTIDLIELSLQRGVPIVASYGMTETCAQISANPMLQPRGVYFPKKSVGKIFEPNSVQLRDPETGKVLPRNEVGELWLKGPQVIDEYLNPALNERAFDQNGWFKTGDFGHLSRQGQLFIKDRRTDRIITGGENVDPAEVEAALNRLPGIRKSAVFGIEDPEWGQKVVALIVSEQGKSPDKENIRDSLKKHLSGFKIPKEFHVVESIPESSMGKILRNKLQDLYPGQ